MLQQSTRPREALAARRCCLSDCISTPSTFNHITQCHVQLDRNINYTDACVVALIDQASFVDFELEVNLWKETRLSGPLYYPTGDELITSRFPNGPTVPLLSCSSGSQLAWRSSPPLTSADPHRSPALSDVRQSGMLDAEGEPNGSRRPAELLCCKGAGRLPLNSTWLYRVISLSPPSWIIPENDIQIVQHQMTHKVSNKLVGKELGNIPAPPRDPQKLLLVLWCRQLGHRSRSSGLNRLGNRKEGSKGREETSQNSYTND
ncbi:hypothetical protein EYF80_001043 [Liparis tanakae]|uniref:Uncharacterized protein n=1 Tax=Liparis tanakae TaxID=230148 RepID=A0A4Z2JFA9_9TELE|nr:hypothetical protein EYF80_001043 [Liparis tanakae]